eukprot:SAG22_NODE_2527_length_2474_cov_16.432421_1_plen_212_part_00
MLHAGQDTRSNMFMLDYQKKEMKVLLAKQAKQAAAQAEAAATAAAEAAQVREAEAEAAAAELARGRAAGQQAQKQKTVAGGLVKLDVDAAEVVAGAGKGGSGAALLSSGPHIPPKISMTHKTSWTVGYSGFEGKSSYQVDREKAGMAAAVAPRPPPGGPAVWRPVTAGDMALHALLQPATAAAPPCVTALQTAPGPGLLQVRAEPHGKALS